MKIKIIMAINRILIDNHLFHIFAASICYHHFLETYLTRPSLIITTLDILINLKSIAASKKKMSDHQGFMHSLQYQNTMTRKRHFTILPY